MTISVAPPPGRGDGEHLGHDGWVTEFEAFQSSMDDLGKGKLPAVPTTARSKRSTRSGCPTNPVEDLKAEMKLLRWHKLANEAALKAALLKTKKIKAQGGGFTKPIPAATTLAMPIEERAAWMQQVIEEEQSKPLQVSKEAIIRYEAEERLKDERLDNEVSGHIRSLRKLRQKVEKRGEMQARRAKYRSALKELEVEREQLFIGKVLEPQNRSQEDKVKGEGQKHYTTNGSGAQHRAMEGQGMGGERTVGALNTVLGSLNKLVDLEKRITLLERSNVYDDFCSSKGKSKPRGKEGTECVEMDTTQAATNRVTSGASRSGHGRLSFSKQKVEASIKGPSRYYYAVHLNRQGRGGGRNCSGSAVSRTGVAQLNGRRGRNNSLARGQVSGAPSLLTSLPDVRGRSNRSGIGGGGRGNEGSSFRSAKMEKRRREAKKKIAGEKAEAQRIARQDRIIREWMQRKRSAAASSVRCGGVGDSQRLPLAGRKIPPGVRRVSNSNRLEEFHSIRAQYSRRKEVLRKDLNRRQRAPTFSRDTNRESSKLPPAVSRRLQHHLSAGPTARPTQLSHLRPQGPGRGPRRLDQRGIAMSTAQSMFGSGKRQLQRPVNEQRAFTNLAVGGTGIRAARARHASVKTRQAIGTKRRWRQSMTSLPSVSRGCFGGASRSGMGTVKRWT